jgi:hypothetical protein
MVFDWSRKKERDDEHEMGVLVDMWDLPYMGPIGQY